mgnify:CR=1 FL=1
MTKTPSLDRLAFMLAMLSAIGPFAIDAYLPAFPQIAATLGATRLEVQQTLTIYMAALALMVLWHGALADRFGRRRVMLLLTAVFAVASLICALAPSIEWLWLGRALQGVSGGGPFGLFNKTTGFAIIGQGKDRYKNHVAIAIRGTKFTSGNDWLTNANIGYARTFD